MIEYRLTMKILREVGITILIAIAIFFCLRATVQGQDVHGVCMLPNIEHGELVMVNKATYWFSDPQRGDVIVFDPPVPSEYPFIKRVIGLPGETVEVKNGQVFINNILLDEPYILPEPPRRNKNFGPEELSDSEYFVLGDNRNNSNDSRSWGLIKRDSIIGKAWFVYWPPDKCELVKHYSPDPDIGGKGIGVCIPIRGIT